MPSNPPFPASAIHDFDPRRKTSWSCKQIQRSKDWKWTEIYDATKLWSHCSRRNVSQLQKRQKTRTSQHVWQAVSTCVSDALDTSSSHLIRLLTRIQITRLVWIEISCEVLVRLNEVNKSKIWTWDRISHPHLDIEGPGQNILCFESQVCIFLQDWINTNSSSDMSGFLLLVSYNHEQTRGHERVDIGQSLSYAHRHGTDHLEMQGNHLSPSPHIQSHRSLEHDLHPIDAIRESPVYHEQNSFPSLVYEPE